MAKISVDKKIDQLSKKFDKMKKGAVKFEHDAEKRISDNPMQSVAVAFGAGVVAGAVVVALMRRTR